MPLAGALTDYLVIGSDSGKIVIVEWHAASNTWRRVHEETFGRTGVRRIVPGQFLAADPKGRAIIIGKNNNIIDRRMRLWMAGLLGAVLPCFLESRWGSTRVRCCCEQ